MRWMVPFALVLFATATCGCEAAPACDAATLAARLEGASAGDVVSIGDCRIDGRFTVGAGVTLEGTGPGSAIAADSLGPALRLRGGDGAASVVRDLRVVSRQHAAIWAEGGDVVIEDVVLEVPTGVGVAAQDVASLSLTRVAVEGALTPAADAPAMTSPMDSPTHGLALFRVTNARLEDVDIGGFATFGALIVDSTARWERGAVHDSRGTGVMISGGSAELIDVAIQRLWRHDEGLVLSYGLVVAKGARVRTTRLEASDNAELGLLQDEASAEHVDLSVHDNGHAGLWAQDATALMLMGSGSEFVRNRVAGLVLLESNAVTVADATIDETIEDVGFGAVRAGDGVHIVGGRGIVLRGLGLSGNERVQVLVDLTTTLAREIQIDGVTVDGAGAELGVIAQGGATPADWDASVTRLGETAVNDAAHTGLLGTLGAVTAIPTEPAGGNIAGVVMPID